MFFVRPLSELLLSSPTHIMLANSCFFAHPAVTEEHNYLIGDVKYLMSLLIITFAYQNVHTAH